jgi:hypothetical protein
MDYLFTVIHTYHTKKLIRERVHLYKKLHSFFI